MQRWRWGALRGAGCDLDAAGIAPAVLVVFDQLEGLVDLLDQLALAVTGTQFQAEFFFLAGAVGRIGEVGASSCMWWTVRSTSSINSTFTVEDVGEVSAHAVAHVLLTLGFPDRARNHGSVGARLLSFGGHDGPPLTFSNPFRRSWSVADTAGPAAASGRTYQNDSGHRTPSYRGCCGRPEALVRIRSFVSMRKADGPVIRARSVP